MAAQIGLPFGEEDLRKKREEIRSTTPPVFRKGKTVPNYNWTVVGLAASGKSSLLSAITTSLSMRPGFVVDRFKIGTGGAHGTIAYDQYTVSEIDPLQFAGYNLCFFDLWGGTPGSFKAATVPAIMEGHLPGGFVGVDQMVSLQDPRLQPAGLATAPHGILLVVDASNWDKVLNVELFDKFMDYCDLYDVPRFIVITKIDLVDPKMKTDPQLAYQSVPLATLRTNVATKYKVLPRDVLFGKGNIDSAESCPKHNALNLYAAAYMADKTRQYLLRIANGTQTKYAGYSSHPMY